MHSSKVGTDRTAIAQHSPPMPYRLLVHPVGRLVPRLVLLRLSPRHLLQVLLRVLIRRRHSKRRSVRPCQVRQVVRGSAVADAAGSARPALVLPLDDHALQSEAGPLRPFLRQCCGCRLPRPLSRSRTPSLRHLLGGRRGSVSASVFAAASAWLAWPARAL